MNNNLHSLRSSIVASLISARGESEQEAADAIMKILDTWEKRLAEKPVFLAHAHQLEQCGGGEITGLAAHNKKACEMAGVELVPLYLRPPGVFSAQPEVFQESTVTAGKNAAQPSLSEI